MTFLPAKETARSLLEELKKPWPASNFTLAQEQSRADVLTAKALWVSTLQEYRNYHIPMTKSYNLMSTRQPFFPFLDLPAEIRNQIYDICLADEKDERDPDMEQRQVETYGIRGSQTRLVYDAYQNRVHHIRNSIPTPTQLQRDSERRTLLDRIIQRLLKREEKGGKLTAGARGAFERYQLEHKMYTTQPRRDKKKTHATNTNERENISTKTQKAKRKAST
jgi:hypothetical protein